VIGILFLLHEIARALTFVREREGAVRDTKFKNHLPSLQSSLVGWIKTHAAPMPLLSKGPPATAVLPSADSATDQPCSALRWAVSTSSLPTSLLPCCVQTPSLAV